MRDKRELLKVLQVEVIQVGHTWPRAEIRSNDKDDQRLCGTLAPLEFKALGL